MDIYYKYTFNAGAGNNTYVALEDSEKEILKNAMINTMQDIVNDPHHWATYPHHGWNLRKGDENPLGNSYEKGAPINNLANFIAQDRNYSMKVLTGAKSYSKIREHNGETPLNLIKGKRPKNKQANSTTNIVEHTGEVPTHLQGLFSPKTTVKVTITAQGDEAGKMLGTVADLFNKK